MAYSFNFIFDIVGVSPILQFFNHQQSAQQPNRGAEYLAAYHCTLDAFIESAEAMPMRQGWQLDRVVDSVITFWLNNADQIEHWKRRLGDAGSENLLIARVADVDALKTEFESLLRYRL